MRDEVEELLRACSKAHRKGADFPTVWITILRTHPLVAGLPIQRMAEGEAQLEIRLVTGQHLIFSSTGFRLG